MVNKENTDNPRGGKMKIIQKPSPNHRKQNNIKKVSITLHWMVGTLAGTDRHFANPKSRVATHYGIADKKVHQYVDEKDYAFANGNKKANETSISIEHEGGWLLKDGTRKKPTQQTHDTSAELVAEIAKRWKMGKLEIGKNVFPHKHWVATACPGTLDMEYIVNKANQILQEKPQLDEKPVQEKPQLDGTEIIVHRVKIGETLGKIANKYGTTVQHLQTINKIKNANLIFPGQSIKVERKVSIKKPQPKPQPKPKTTIHVVRKNENLTLIANKYKTTVEAIVKENKIKNASLIYVGQKLKITK